MWKIFRSFCQYLRVLISNRAQEVFFWRLGVGINQINWIVCSIEQPAMNQIFPFLRLSPFLDRSRAFLGYLLQLVSLYISFHPHHCKSRLSKNYFISVLFTILYFIFQFRSPVARWTSTGPATTGPESTFSTWKHLLTLIAIIASPNPENITLQWWHHLYLTRQDPWRWGCWLYRVESCAEEAQCLHGPQWDHLLPRGKLFSFKIYKIYKI